LFELEKAIFNLEWQKHQLKHERPRSRNSLQGLRTDVLDVDVEEVL
jgi:hypothetical protein